MAFNFPNSPNNNQEYIGPNGIKYRYDGTKWKGFAPLAQGSSVGYTGSKGVIGYTGSKGDQGIQGVIGYTGSAGTSGSAGEKGDNGSPIGGIVSVSTSRSLTSTDANQMLLSSASGAITLTIPTDATYNYPIGTVIHITQDGTGQVTIAGDSGVTTRIRNGLTNKTAVQYSTCTAAKISANYWYLFGDLE